MNIALILFGIFCIEAAEVLAIDYDPAVAVPVLLLFLAGFVSAIWGLVITFKKGESTKENNSDECGD